MVKDILRSVEEQRALEVAPRSVGPIQPTIATVVQSYLNHPDIDRLQEIEAIKFLNQPMLAVQVCRLRRVYREFQVKGDIKTLLNSIEELRKSIGAVESNSETTSITTTPSLKREDLRLISFDFLISG